MEHAQQGEREFVTVMFVDVPGINVLADLLGLEESRQVIDPILTLMFSEVPRYDGALLGFLGDGLVEVFRAAVGREDHAIRALRSAQGMQQALAGYRHPLASEHGIDLRGRIGLNTGAVIVDRIKILSRGRENFSFDPMTNLAASLLNRAAPGQILVGAETATAAGSAFALRPLGEGIWTLQA